MILRFAIEVPNLFSPQHNEEQFLGYAVVEWRIAEYNRLLLERAAERGMNLGVVRQLAELASGDMRGEALASRAAGGPWS